MVLVIENRQDAEDFVRRLAQCQDNPLKTLTGEYKGKPITTTSSRDEIHGH